MPARKSPVVGLTFELLSVGSDVEIRYITSQGGHNERETQTYISKRSPKEFAYMPGDINGIPDWIEVEWQYGLVEARTYDEVHKNARQAKAHFDLRAMIPEKLIGTFNDDKLDLRYEVYQWRK